MDLARCAWWTCKLSRVGPDSFYAVSKLCGEAFGSLYARVYGAFDFVALRIGWCLYDDPRDLQGTGCGDYLRAMWLSRRDFRGFLRGALQCGFKNTDDLRRGFAMAYAVSRNGRRLFDLEESVATLGYDPVDDAETFFQVPGAELVSGTSVVLLATSTTS